MTGIQPDSGEQRELIARLLWFRSDHPDGEVETELVMAQADMAVCRATLRAENAGSASGHGSALREQAGPSYVEQAENRALSRALMMLGYATTAPEEDVVDDDSPAPSVPIDMVSARTLLREEPPAHEYDDRERTPQPIRSAASDRTTDDNAADTGADVNWNKFWTWARQRGYTTAKELNELLGVDNVLAFTPREVRQMLVKYEMDNPPGGQDE